jgi:hypothetical protein
MLAHCCVESAGQCCQLATGCLADSLAAALHNQVQLSAVAHHGITHALVVPALLHWQGVVSL